MKKIISEKNPELVTRKDNKAQWNLPNKRRLGFRNLYKINRDYGYKNKCNKMSKYGNGIWKCYFDEQIKAELLISKEDEVILAKILAFQFYKHLCSFLEHSFLTYLFW